MTAAATRPYPATTVSAAVLHYVRAREDAARILRDAAAIEGLPPILKAHGTTCANLCLQRVHRVIGDGDAHDLAALNDALQAVAKHVDPLIEAIGDEAAAVSSDVDTKLFKGQLFGAIDGNATYELESAAEKMRESAADTEADFDWRLRAGR